jgi:DNA-binding MarR family transcriptional regulator
MSVSTDNRSPVQSKPALVEDSFQQLLVCSEQLSTGLVEILKPFHVSPPLYAVLFVLHNADSSGLGCAQIGARLPSRAADVTRLVDRLESADLVARHRDPKDRRIVRVRLTVEGWRLANQLRNAVHSYLEAVFTGIKPKRLRKLIETLQQVGESNKIRYPVEPNTFPLQQSSAQRES